MAEESDKSETLNIRCPDCRQKFSISTDLKDRMVECGSCESHFRITDEVIVTTKRFYPGERKAAKLEHFQRVPLSISAVPEGLQTMRYQEFDNKQGIGSSSPQRTIAGVVGVLLMFACALVYVVSSGPDAAFSAMPLTKQLSIFGFVAIVGSCLMIYANRRNRIKAVFLSIALSTGLLSLPFFLEKSAVPEITTERPDDFEELTALREPEVNPLAKFRERFGTKPLEDEIERLEANNSEKSAYGIYLTNIVPRNMYTARDYLIRGASAGPSSHPYPRDDGHYLIILTEVALPFEKVTEVAASLGDIEETHAEIGVIVVRVNNEQFVAGSADKLNDKNDPAYYELNMAELRSIDMDRVQRAVERFSSTEPIIYQGDITKLLLSLMEKPGVDFYDDLSTALLTWSEDIRPASEAAVKVVRRKIDAGEPIPEPLGELVALGASPDGAVIMIDLWTQTPVIWDKYLARFGSGIEPALIAKLDSDEPPLVRSSIRLLGEVGTSNALPHLRKLSNSADPELRMLAQRSIGSINNR